MRSREVSWVVLCGGVSVGFHAPAGRGVCGGGLTTAFTMAVSGVSSGDGVASTAGSPLVADRERELPAA